MIPIYYQQFADALAAQLAQDEEFIALAAGGSWIEGQMDRYSDIDLVIVHRSGYLTIEQRKAIAAAAGDLLVCFTGEHVGEPRLLICLYDNPLLHVDLKFVDLSGMASRVEDPVVIWQRDNSLTSLLSTTKANFPHPDYQWLEDRFWVWIHYAASKIGRGELFETLTFLSFMQQTVLGPLALISQGALPKGVRKLEMILPSADLEKLRQTNANYNRQSCLSALYHVVNYYQTLRKTVMKNTIVYHHRAEARVNIYLADIQKTIQVL